MKSAKKYPGLIPIPEEDFITLMDDLTFQDKFDKVSNRQHTNGRFMTNSADLHTEAEILEEMLATLRTTGRCTWGFYEHHLPFVLDPILTEGILDLTVPIWRRDPMWYIETIRTLVPRLEEHDGFIYNHQTGRRSYAKCSYLVEWLCHPRERAYIPGGAYYELSCRHFTEFLTTGSIVMPIEEPPVDPIPEEADPVGLQEVAGFHMALAQLYFRQLGGDAFHADDLPELVELRDGVIYQCMKRRQRSNASFIQLIRGLHEFWRKRTAKHQLTVRFIRGLYPCWLERVQPCLHDVPVVKTACAIPFRGHRFLRAILKYVPLEEDNSVQ